MPINPVPPAEQQRIEDFSREVAEAFQEIAAANQSKETDLENIQNPADEG